MYRVHSKTLAPKLVALLGFFSLASTLMAAKTVYTTNSTGSPQNQNLFTLKAEAFVRDEIDGTYYFEVTNPNGSVILSTDNASCRQITVTGGIVSTALSGGCAHAVGSNNNAVQLIEFSDTPNGGGEYKVFVIPQSCGTIDLVDPKKINRASSCDNSDNFKVKEVSSGPPQSAISGVKYYDTAANGVLDPSDPPIENWQVNITLGAGTLVTQFTDAAGFWSVIAPVGTAYVACEVIPGGTSWVQTGPLVGAVSGGATANASRCWGGIFGVGDTIGLNFGNAVKIDGKKYYDSGPSSLVPNGQFDAGELGIAGFKILVGFCDPLVTPICTYTPATTVITGVGGAWSLLSPLPPNGGAKFQACEVLPAGGYKQTGPLTGASNGGTATAIAPGGGTSKCWLGTLSATVGANSGLDFGNICLGGGNALSKGWWTNKGNPSITANALLMLRNLNLRNSNGSDFDPTTNAQVSSFLGGATATNMANMLSAQLATVELDVFITPPGTNGNAIIYAPGTTSANALGFASLKTVMAEGNAELGLHPLAGSGTAWRSYQEALKNAFDNAANNLNFVQTGACPVVYP